MNDREDLAAMDVAGRAERLRPLLEEAGADALVVSDLTNVRYLTGFTGSAGLVVVTEAGRALDAGDVAEVLGVPVVAEVAVDPAVARVVDAGLLLARPPRPLQRGLRHAA